MGTRGDVDPGPDLRRRSSARRGSRWKKWLTLAVVLVVAVLGLRALDRTIPIIAYSVIDERTLVVGVAGNGNAGTRVTAIEEGPSSVTISASMFHFQPGPGTAASIPMELTVRLRSPLGSRSVVDGNTGATVQLSRCPWPYYFAPGCT
jgi:hypothetical protein